MTEPTNPPYVVENSGRGQARVELTTSHGPAEFTFQWRPDTNGWHIELPELAVVDKHNNHAYIEGGGVAWLDGPNPRPVFDDGIRRLVLESIIKYRSYSGSSADFADDMLLALHDAGVTIPQEKD